MIRRILTTTMICMTLFAANCLAEEHSGHQHGAARASSRHADVHQHADCKQCGMDREKFSSSRMLITYADGTSAGTCSIACMVTELKGNKGKAVKSIQVGDYNTRALIDAEKAVWVIGGDLPGVMAPVATWAFAKKSAAEAFIKKHGGKIASYKDAFNQVAQ